MAKKSMITVHPDKAKVYHVGICSDDGSPKWDQMLHVEPVGGRSVVVNSKGEFRMIEVDRPLVRNIEEYDFLSPDLSQMGRPSLEFPRGFPKKGETSDEAVRREVGEETRFAEGRVVFLGYGSPNTTYHPVPQPVYLVEVDENKMSELPPDIDERIFRGEWYTREQLDELVANGQIWCDMTLSALYRYDAWRRTRERLEQRRHMENLPRVVISGEGTSGTEE